MHQRGSRPRRPVLPHLHGGGRGCMEQKKRVSDSRQRTETAHVRKAAAQAARPHSPAVAPGCRLCRKSWKPDSLGCSMEGTRTAPYLSVKPRSWDGMRTAAVRGDGRASLPAHKLPPVNTGTGALALLQGRREGHAGQPRAEQRVGYLSADLALLTVTPHLQKHPARGAVKMDTAGETFHTPGSGPTTTPSAQSLLWPRQPPAWGLSSATAPITAERRKGGPGSTSLSQRTVRLSSQ